MSPPDFLNGVGRKLRLALRGALLPIGVILFWQGLSALGWINVRMLPSPVSVALRWWAYLAPLEAYDPANQTWIWWIFSGELLTDAIASLYRVLVGFVVGAGLALPVGLAMGASRKLYDLANPLLQVLRPIPPIAYIPLSILWFGLGNPPAIFLIAIGAFFPTLMNTIAGVRQVDSIYLRAARNLGAGQLTIFWRIMLPAATPYIFAGMRIAMGTSFIVVIVSEMIAVNNGLGYRILEAREFFWSDKIIAGMLTIGLIGLGIDSGMSWLNNYLLRWHRGLDA
jgi:NitT/TauT family transport system permease protein